MSYRCPRSHRTYKSNLWPFFISYCLIFSATYCPSFTLSHWKRAFLRGSLCYTMCSYKCWPNNWGTLCIIGCFWNWNVQVSLLRSKDIYIWTDIPFYEMPVISLGIYTCICLFNRQIFLNWILYIMRLTIKLLYLRHLDRCCIINSIKSSFFVSVPCTFEIFYRHCSI